MKVYIPGISGVRGRRIQNYEEEIIAYLGIFDKTGHIPALIPLQRKDIHATTLEFTMGDGVTYELKHSNPFQILGKKIRETIYLCQEGAEECVNPEAWFKKYHTQGSFTAHTIEAIQRLIEIKQKSQEQFSTMKNLGLIIILGGAAFAVAVALNAVFLHAGAAYHPPPAPVIPPTNSTGTH